MTDTTRPDGVLAAYAEGRIHHLNRGLCPDEMAGHSSRDPDCPVCAALTAPASNPTENTDQLLDRVDREVFFKPAAPASKPAGITEAFERLVQEYTGRDMAYHKRNKTTGLDFARRAFEAGVSFAKPAEGGVVEALNNLIHAINWRAGVYASGSSQEKMAFADEHMWKCVDAGKAALAREGGE